MDYKKLPVPAKCEPAAVMVEAGKTYAWCTCGLSEKQPFCDAAHKQCWTEDENGEVQKHFVSLKFTAEKTEEVWLCQCKQTKTPPFCDSSHRNVKCD
ncbi:MAG TPA: CDGSH iron-sulfur domain-containing protein [Phnomibacter sp.]|nr:CDGSH iron-sulfur domain-containing protein [Phnomibacter sp.]